MAKKEYTKVKSYKSKSSNKVYWVSRDQDLNLSCNCPGWIFNHSRGGNCRHIRQYLNEDTITAVIPKRAKRKELGKLGRLSKKLSEVLNKPKGSDEVERYLKVFGGCK